MAERDPHHPVTRRDERAWLASWVAPLAGSAALALFGLWVLWPSLEAFKDRPRLHAWLISLAVLAGFVALAAHWLVVRHGAVSPHFSHDEKAELQWKLRRGRGYGRWRRLMKEKHRHWYKGRSHSGEHPRYD